MSSENYIKTIRNNEKHCLRHLASKYKLSSVQRKSTRVTTSPKPHDVQNYVPGAHISYVSLTIYNQLIFLGFCLLFQEFIFIACNNDH